MTHWAPHLYKQEGERRGVALSIINEALRQTIILQDAGLPAILTLGHLAFHTHISYWKLRTFVARRLVIRDDESEPKAFQPYDPYKSFRIKKHSGGFRRICVPETDLMKVQQWIDRLILSQIKASPYSYAFEKGQSILDCAKQHLGCRWLIKIDLRNFFESLSEIQVYHVFRGIGYQSLVSFELARICTKVRESKHNIKPRWLNNKARSITAYQNSMIGHLPQGAPTSPKLANLIVIALDRTVANIAKRYDLTYTRYADDMAFSTDSLTFSRDTAKALIQEIHKVLPQYGLRPHPQKVHVIPPSARKVVLGLIVDGDKIRLSKDFRSTLECHWFYCKKDPVSHASKRGFLSVFGLKNYVSGLIAYAKQIDLAYVDTIAEKYGEIVWPV